MSIKINKNMSNEIDDFKDLYKRHYISAQYAWVRCMSEQLADCSRVFGGDLQTMMTLAIIGQSALARLIQTGIAGPVADLANMEEPFERGGTNASRLADVTGIPRQTVRRKLAKLAAAGWIEQDGSAGWRLTASESGEAHAGIDLADLQDRTITRVGRLIMDFNRLAANDAKRGPGNQ